MSFDLTTELSIFLREFIQNGGMAIAGTGSPEGAVAGNVGWLYTDLGGALYQKTSGTGTTGWTAVGGSSSVLTSTQNPPDGSGITPTLAGAGAGSVTNGAHRFAFTITTPAGETTIGNPTAAVTVVDNTTDGKVRVTVPTASAYYATEAVYPTGVNVYATQAGGTSYFLTNYSGAGNIYGDTFTLNQADAALVTAAPSTNTAIEPALTIAANGVLTLPISAYNNFGDYELVMPDALSGDPERQLNIAGQSSDVQQGGNVRISGGSSIPMFAGSVLIKAGRSDQAGQGGTVRLYGGTGVEALQVDPTSRLLLQVETILAAGQTITGEYKAASGNPGLTTTITSASLVGKTITVENGLITGFA